LLFFFFGACDWYKMIYIPSDPFFVEQVHIMSIFIYLISTDFNGLLSFYSRDSIISTILNDTDPFVSSIIRSQQDHCILIHRRQVVE
jgi:hypothetical protein